MGNRDTTDVVEGREKLLPSHELPAKSFHKITLIVNRNFGMAIKAG
jgi:hypothetical protein